MTEDIVYLLNSLQSPNDNERTSAEDQYNKLNSSQKCAALSKILIDASKTVETRGFVAVLLRRVLVQLCSKDSNEGPIGKTERNAIMELLFQNIANNTLRKSICDVVAEFAHIYSETDEPWNEIVPALLKLIESNNRLQILNVLNVMGNFPGVFGDQFDNYYPVVQQLFVHYMKSEELEVRNATSITYASFVKHHRSSKDITKALGQNLETYLSVVIQSIYDTCHNTDVLQSLEDLIEEIPKFIRPNLEEFSRKALEALNNEDVTSEAKHMIIEIFITLSEISSKMFLTQFCPNYLQLFVQYLLKMMCEIDDEDPTEWAVKDDDDETDDMADNIVAETGLDRLSSALGLTEESPKFLNITMELINSMLASSDWQHKVAGLLALSAIGEGSHKSMQPMLTNLVDGVLYFLNDTHPRVRYAACNAIGQMSEDFQPQLQKLRHSSAFPAIIQVMNDNSMPKVQSHATAALVNLMSGCPMPIFKKYIDGVATVLDKLLDEKFKEFMSVARYNVLEQIISTISAVADIADENFKPYYDRFIGKLLRLLFSVSASQYQNLHGKVIECITLVGSTVGKERFIKDCQPVMEDLMKIKLDVDSMETEEFEMTFVLAAWSRICMILGKDFVQYLPIIIEPIIKAASFRPQITVVAEDETKDLEDETSDWEFLSLGDKQSFGIRTTGLEYKANACLLLSCCARELKEVFEPYIDRVIELMIPLLRFYFFDSVRSAVAESLPNMLDCVSSNPDRLHKMWQTIRPVLLNAISIEPDGDVCCQLMSSLAKILEIIYPNTLTPGDLEEINKTLLELLQKYINLKDDDKNDSNDEGYEDYDENELKSIVVNKLSDIVHVSFRIMKKQYVPYFEQFIPIIKQLIDPERPLMDRQWIICCFDDLIEFTGPESFKYSEIFLQPMFTMIKDDEPEVRQAVSYGIGLMAQYGGDQYTEFVQKCINPLLEVIAAPDSRSDESEVSTENAISAITKAMMSQVFTDKDRQKMIPMWLSWLPTYDDHDESEYIYGYLCMLMESGNEIVLGANNSNMPHLMGIFADCFLQDGIDMKRASVKRMASLIKQVEVNEQMSQLCNEVLDEEKKLALHNAVKECNLC